MRVHKRQYKNTCVECNKEYLAVQKRFKFCSSTCAHRNTYTNNMLDYKWRLSKLLALAKNRAKEKHLSFDLTHDYLVELWESNLGCCAVTGRLFNLEPSDIGLVNKNAPSIDRIEPKKGYTKENVRIIVYMLNCAIGEYGLDELRNLANDLNSGVAY